MNKLNEFCEWEDCDQEPVYCEGHAHELVNPLGLNIRGQQTEIERLTAENEVLREDNLTLMATNAEQFKDSERLQARVEKLESERKRDCVAFFQWWWNQPGSNTAQGYDEWIAATE